ncbi:ABC transporter substrate-binding protein [Cohnella yongneupensis]|uniref:ABC transporter substrate-binding protein n=1 Tax=Cohnella yongneupensis TaxID=425006 RepID=A0ABW0R028_9BACL
MRKSSILCIGLALSLATLTGCGNNNNGASPSPTQSGAPGASQPAGNAIGGKITVLTNRTDLVDDGTMAKYADKFKEKYPDAEVEFEGLTNYATDVQVRLTTGEAGDVLLIPGSVPDSELSQYFEPLPDTLFDNVYFADLMKYDGKHYGLATGVNTQGIVYNKQAFIKAGIDKIPSTLDEFYADADKLKNAGITPLYMNFGAQWPMKSWGEESVWFTSGDPQYLSKMVQQDAPWQLNNEWGKMLTIARTLVQKGYVEKDLSTNNWELSKGDVASGKAAMYYLGNWVIPQIIGAGGKSEDIGFFPLPYDNSGKLNAPLGQDWMIGVSKSSSNKELATKWVEFFVKDSGYVESSGFIPVDKSKEPTLPQLAEFKSFAPNYIESQSTDPKFAEIGNKAEIGFYTGDYIQTLVTAKDLQKAFDDLNAKWKKGKAAVGT